LAIIAGDLHNQIICCDEHKSNKRVSQVCSVKDFIIFISAGKLHRHVTLTVIQGNMNVWNHLDFRICRPIRETPSWCRDNVPCVNAWEDIISALCSSLLQYLSQPIATPRFYVVRYH